jgi:hypothetical protein
MKHKQTQSEADIIRQFDKQIRYELYEFMYMHKCPSYWGKKLFIETRDFNVYNWKIIQTDEYLFKKNKREGADMYKFMYETVLEHKKRLVKVDNVMYYDVS